MKLIVRTSNSVSETLPWQPALADTPDRKMVNFAVGSSTGVSQHRHLYDDDDDDEDRKSVV
jgi:hypothetical protein